MENSVESFTILRKTIEALPNQQLKQCVRELIKLHDTGILPNGKVKKLRALTDDLHILESVITNQALIRYAK